MGIEVLPPDVNECGHRFVVVGGNIRFGLDAVKNVGAAAVDAIIAAREEGGAFSSLWELLPPVDCRSVNKKAIEALIKCGASTPRAPRAPGCCRCSSRPREPGRRPSRTPSSARRRSSSWRSPPRRRPAGGPDLPVPALPDERAQLNVWERESLGLFLSSHPSRRCGRR